MPTLEPWVWLVIAVVVVLLVAYGLADHSPTHCARCGSALVWRRRLVGYDVHGGEPIFVDYRSCPNAERTRYPSTLLWTDGDMETYAPCSPASIGVDPGPLG